MAKGTWAKGYQEAQAKYRAQLEKEAKLLAQLKAAAKAREGKS